MGASYERSCCSARRRCCCCPPDEATGETTSDEDSSDCSEKDEQEERSTIHSEVASLRSGPLGDIPSEERWGERWGSVELPQSMSGSITSAGNLQQEEATDSEVCAMDISHDFEVITLTHPDWCSRCGTFLVGLWDQGSRCTHCDVLVCHSCALLGEDCPSRATERIRCAAADREVKLRARIAELERQLASQGGSGMASKPPVPTAKPTASSLASGLKRQKSPEEVVLPVMSLRPLGTLKGHYLQDAMQVPDKEINDFLQTKPLLSQNLLGMSVAQISSVLKDPEFLETVFKEDVGAFDIIGSKWQNAVKSSNTLIRGFKYSVPCPDDVPSAVKSVISLPPHGSCKAFARLKSNGEEAVLTMQFLTEGFPLGENVRLQVTDAFVGNGKGVSFRRWAVVVWVKELPWHIRFLKGIIVSQVMEKGKTAGEILAQSLQKAVQKL